VWARLADRVDLVEDDDMQIALVAALLILSLRVREEQPDVLLALAHVLVEHLGTVDDLRLLA